MKTVSEIAAMFGVTGNAVRKWIKGGLPYKKEKIIGIKTRIIISPEDVYRYHRAKEEIKVKKGE
jgi:predicted transcriptional regulator